jgi:uncharacterized protein (DUF302 family)
MPIRKTLFASLVVLAVVGLMGVPRHSAHAADGLIVKDSDFGVTKTVDRLGIALERKGITVFKRINHAKGAESVGMKLAAAEVIFFGTPKLGTLLMQSNPMIGLDLPLRALVWKAADGSVKLAYTDAAWLANRHGITDKAKVFKKMAGALDKFTEMAVRRGGLPKQ